MAKVLFYSLTQAKYDSLVSLSQVTNNALYFTLDTHRLYKGADRFSKEVEFITLGVTN